MKRIKNEDFMPEVLTFDIERYSDERGWLTEVFRSDELPFTPEMTYISQTLPGVMRGPHEHKEQTDFFVFLGPGSFNLYLWKVDDQKKVVECVQHVITERQPKAVLIPPGIIHAYKCTSEYPGVVINCPNKLYAGKGKQYEVDEIRHEDDKKFVKMLMKKMEW